MTLGQVVAKNIKARRKKMGMSQQALSKLCRLTVRYISRLENTGPNITLEVFERIAQALECSPRDFMEVEVARSYRRRDLENLERAMESLRRLKLSLDK